jgi:hypothetical protein
VVLVAPVALVTALICACGSMVDGTVAVLVAVATAAVALEFPVASAAGSCEPPLQPAADAATHSMRKSVRMLILKSETAELLVDEAETAGYPCAATRCGRLSFSNLFRRIAIRTQMTALDKRRREFRANLLFQGSM